MMIIHGMVHGDIVEGVRSNVFKAVVDPYGQLERIGGGSI